eukprot:TRINITY_DN3798_c0_g2_i2.p1 TRINITY_DN3798_c0_g2~~TRINITY_DN3798_c0_g2_i2.p1  ORF type:complete len:103 (-),score=2.03 TRINITY_DN3798_c0_g2_i2:156-464(-)
MFDFLCVLFSSGDTTPYSCYDTSRKEASTLITCRLCLFHVCDPILTALLTSVMFTRRFSDEKRLAQGLDLLQDVRWSRAWITGLTSCPGGYWSTGTNTGLYI